MTITFSRPVRKYDQIKDASENEVAQLAALSKGAGILKTSQEAAQTIIDNARLDNKNGSRANRPITVKRMWDNVVENLTTRGKPKPANPDLSAQITAFLETAVRAGYSKTNELAKDLGASPELLNSIPSMAVSGRAHTDNLRVKRREARSCRFG